MLPPLPPPPAPPRVGRLFIPPKPGLRTWTSGRVPWAGFGDEEEACLPAPAPGLWPVELWARGSWKGAPAAAFAPPLR